MIFRILIDPVPASRPRVGRWGTFYKGLYAVFRKACPTALEAIRRPWYKHTGPVFVTLRCYRKRPKKTDRQYPVGDVDNYSKSVLDALTVFESIWNDDDQVTDLLVSKRYAPPGEPGYIDVKIEPSKLE